VRVDSRQLKVERERRKPLAGLKVGRFEGWEHPISERLGARGGSTAPLPFLQECDSIGVSGWGVAKNVQCKELEA
jgi:hypothetical protein